MIPTMSLVCVCVCECNELVCFFIGLLVGQAINRRAMTLTNRFYNDRTVLRSHVFRLFASPPIRIYCNAYCIRFPNPMHAVDHSRDLYSIGFLSYWPTIPMNCATKYFLFYSKRPSYRDVQRYHSLVQIHERLMNDQRDLLEERMASIISFQHRYLQKVFTRTRNAFGDWIRWTATNIIR